MKINCKMGGTNHSLAERIPSKNGSNALLYKNSKITIMHCAGPQPEEDEEPTFQQPPKSLSWLLDDLCMVVVSPTTRSYVVLFTFSVLISKNVVGVDDDDDDDEQLGNGLVTEVRASDLEFMNGVDFRNRISN